MHRTPPLVTFALASPSCGPPPPQFRSAAFLRAYAQIERLARHPWVPIVLEGEPGTGKTTFARRIHELSPRAAGPFCYVLLCAIDDALAGSELFGHVSGAYTDARANRSGKFQSAHGGTLFLDEIGKASRSVQQKLLHAVECREIQPVGSDRVVRVDTRIVAATNVNLGRLVDDGSFLSDLNSRLEKFCVVLPPLRERRADIPMLALAAISRYAADCGYANPPSLESGLMVALQQAQWPNNLRELDATMLRLLIEADGAPAIDLSHCRDGLEYLQDANRLPLTQELVETTIAREGNVTAAARTLHVDPSTIHRHVRKWRGQAPEKSVVPQASVSRAGVAPHARD